MRFFDLMKLSTRMFRTRPTRTWLTILGMGVGISAVLFLVSLGYGLQNIILQRIISSDALLSITVVPSNELLLLRPESVSEIASLPKVREVAPLLSVPGQASLNNLNGSVELRAVPPSYFAYAGLTTSVGQFFDSSQSDQVVVSEAVLKLFNFSDIETSLGQPLDLQVFSNQISEEDEMAGLAITKLSKTYHIVGVINEAQSSFIYLPFNELIESLPPQTQVRFDQAQVRVEDSEDMEVVKNSIIEMGYQVMSLSDTLDQANKIFQVIQLVLGLFGAVALVVSAIGMFNTMIVTLLERTNEIGIMRAIGADRRDMQELFLVESVVIGFLGGVVGIGLGIAGGELANAGLNFLARRFGGQPVNLFIYPHWFMGVIMALSTIIGFVAGLIPARRAAGMNPLEALRYK